MKETPTQIDGPISPLILLDLELHKANLGKLIDIDQNESITLIGGHQDFRIYDSTGQLVSEFTSGHVRGKGDYWIVSNGIPKATSFAWHSSLSTTAPMKIKELNLNLFVSTHLINNAGSYVNPPYIAGDMGFQDLHLPEKLLERQIRSVWCGACVILSKAFLEVVGRFDEDFFLYYEDIEFSLRGTSKGYVTIFYPNLVCLHGHSKSTSKKIQNRAYNIWRSRSLFVSKTYGNHLAILLVIKLIIEVFKSSPNRSHIKRVRSNLLPEINATLRGILRAK
jgi:GT2 family glycosyltransferase